MFTTTREINGKQYEGAIELFPGETDVYNVYVKQEGENERGEKRFFFYSNDYTVESEERMHAPFAGTPGFSNDETREHLEGLFDSIN